MKALFVFLGGGCGALLRYGTAYIFPKFIKNHPEVWSTLLSNLMACLLFAFFYAVVLPKFQHNQTLGLLLITGFCGAYSTFSTFAFDNLKLLQNGHWPLFLFNIVISLLLGIGIMWLIMKRYHLST